MALISCGECGNEISDKASTCPRCGAPVGSVSPGSTATERPQLVKSAKSRGIYIILGLFFGFLGVHNFYAGRFGAGVAQLLIVCILGWFVVGFVIVFFWVIVELLTVKTDGSGDAMA